ncbi:myosin-8-like [Chrysoperla carnea]|uniref:myosin-8-like n=1 Tax=Chrysoperla carnea TaxID=189513 RepID=UPI001D079F6F|nr:myosin-8-like [Chrysoperla carnea]
MGKKRTRSEPCNAEDCGETLTLAIVDEFQKLYEKKLAEIDESCDDEHSKEQEKICTLRAWVSDLTEQNKMLVQAVEELEEEASDTVVTLENKLKDSTQKVYNRMSDAYEFYSKQQNELVDHLRNDICNLIEVIRRCREEGRLNADDLTFFEVTCKDVYGDSESSNQILRLNEDASELCSKLEKSEKERLNLQIEFENCTAKLQDKIQENENLISELFKLQKSARDMREALTAEVADKHDSIRALRRENQNLEEQCRQIDKQAHFKDDIIKELRKELRAVKKCELRESTVNKMFDYRKYLMVIKNELKNLRNLIKRSQEYENERENRVSLVNKSVEEINQTFANIKHELYNLESISSQTTSENSEIEHHTKKIHEVIMNSLTNLSQLNSFESINKVVGEIKAMDILYKEQGKNLVLQEIYMNKVKRTFNQTAADILRLQAMLDNFLQENYQIDSKISETQREMHRVQKDLFNTYTKIVKDFKIFNELSDDVLEVCDKNESDYDINEIRLITDQSNMVTHTKTETGDFNSDAGVNTDGNCEMIIDQLQSELKKCQLEKQGLEKMIETCTEKLKKAQIDVSLLEDINEDLHDICNNSNEDTDQGVLIHDLTDMIENYQRKICSLECALQSKDAIIENLQKAVQLHQSTINELKKQCEESQGNNENLQQLVEHLQESLCTVKCQLNDVESKRLKEVSVHSSWGWPNSDSDNGPRQRFKQRRGVHDN